MPEDQSQNGRNMTTILDEIVAAKRVELAESKKQISEAELKSASADLPRPLNLSGALLGGGVRLIAEVKKASPSKGLLMPEFNHLKLAEIYANNGAAAISCLTDLRFQGELSFLRQIKETGASQRAPVIRKDFIFDLYQVTETRAAGADALLLIVAILGRTQLKELLEAAQSQWMQCLVEVHDETELETALEAGAEIIGINNRDLRTFTTDLSVTERIAPLIPRGKQIVSESGIFTRDHIRQMNKVRVNAVLVGEALVTAPDVGEKVRELTGQRAPTA